MDILKMEINNDSDNESRMENFLKINHIKYAERFD